jgi:hypothetical protein
MGPMAHRPTSATTIRSRVLAGLGLAALLLVFGYAVASALDDGEGGGGGGTTAAASTATETAATQPAPQPPQVVSVKLTAVGALDPEGDGVENDDRAPLAVDGDVTTSWATERYQSFFKQGVGLVLDAGAVRRLQRLDLVTATPGYLAEIRAGASPDGPFTTVAPERTVDRLTQFALGGRRARYVVIWVTDLPDDSAAEVAEARLRVRRPG